MRSVWKGTYFNDKQFLCRSSLISHSIVKKKFLVHNGKSYESISIDRKMVGLKIGEFVFTRKMGVLHKKKILNKRGKKK